MIETLAQLGKVIGFDRIFPSLILRLFGVTASTRRESYLDHDVTGSLGVSGLISDGSISMMAKLVVWVVRLMGSALSSYKSYHLL